MLIFSAFYLNLKTQPENTFTLDPPKS